jgi:hypothetical protein
MGRLSRCYKYCLISSLRTPKPSLRPDLTYKHMNLQH